MTATYNVRRLALVGIVALVAALFPLSGALAQDSDGDALNLSGSDNVATAIAWSQVTYTPLGADGPANPVTEVLLGRDDLFADNLASGARQGTAAADDNGAPLLLTDGDDLDADTLAEIDRVTADGATVTILGGENAVSTDVEDDLDAAGYTVERLEGETRIETAVAIAEDTDDADTVLIVRAFPGDSGDDTQAFADSLGAGAVAATNGWDILFTQSDVLTGSTETALTDAGYDAAYVVGGTAAISDDVLDEVTAIVADTERVAGDTRFDTAIALNELREGDLGNVAIIVDGQADDAWADGFAAANLSGLNNYPVVLSNQGDIPAATEDYLSTFDDDATTFAAHFTGVELVCGTTVDADTCADALAAINGNDNGEVNDFPAAAPVGPVQNGTANDRPELLTATLGDLVTAQQESLPGTPQGLRTTFKFDEPIATANGGLYELYAADGTRYTSTAASIDATDNTVVNVRFGTVNTQTIVGSLTLAANARGAATDFSGQPSTQGDYPVGTASDMTVTAGVTAAPDVTTVGNFRPGAVAANTTVVDFTFDENATTTDPAGLGFSLIPTDGTRPVVQCVGPVANTPGSGNTVAGGNGTTVITVDCTNPTPGTNITAANYARGVVAAGSVSDDAADLGQGVAATGNTNPLEAADISAAGLTTEPDLVSGSFNLTITNAGTSYDAAVFNFENPIATVDNQAGLTAYDNQGNTIASLAAPAPQRSGTQVLVYFTDGSLSNAVGISIDAMSVTDNSGFQNEDDEVGVDNPTVATRTPGATANPELTDLSIALNSPPIGTPTNQATFTFDSDLNVAIANVAGMDLYLADGTPLVANACQVGTTEDTDNTVVCTGFTNTGTGNPATSAEIGAAVSGGVDQGSLVSESAAALPNSTGYELV